MKTDYPTIQVELRGNVVVFTMNNPPVNQLSAQFRSDLAEAFSEAYGDDGVKAIVLTGTGKNFIAGAGIGDDGRHEVYEPHRNRTQGRGGGHQRQLPGRRFGNCDVLPLSGRG